MNNPVLFYAELCPDTAPFVAELKKRGIVYDPVNIFESMGNFKRFLQLRDTNAAFDKAKAQGYAGIPALVIDERVILSLDELTTL